MGKCFIYPPLNIIAQDIELDLVNCVMYARTSTGSVSLSGNSWRFYCNSYNSCECNATCKLLIDFSQYKYIYVTQIYEGYVYAPHAWLRLLRKLPSDTYTYDQIIEYSDQSNVTTGTFKFDISNILESGYVCYQNTGKRNYITKIRLSNK